MIYNVKPTTKFQKDLKLIKKRNYNLDELAYVIKKLANGEKLPSENRDHALGGNFQGCRECHIQPDWLLVYEIYKKDLILYLVRTGTHSDIF